MKVTPNSTDVTTYFALRLAATGAEATGLAIANMDLQYVRSGEVPAAKVDATALAATNTAHTDNYGIEIDATDQPGLYRIDWPDAAFAAGVREVILSVKCATAFTEHLRVELETIQTGDSFARIGATGSGLSTLATQASVNTVDDFLDTEVAAILAAVDTEVGAIKAVTDLLPNAGALTSLATQASVNTIDDFLDTEVAAILAAVDTEVGAIKAVTDLLPNAGALTSLATQASVNTIDDFLDTEVAAVLAAVDTEVAAILALLDDARAEPAQGAPPVNPDLATKIDYLYKFMRNKVTVTATTISIFGDDAATVDHKSTHADDAVTYTRGEFVTGP